MGLYSKPAGCWAGRPTMLHDSTLCHVGGLANVALRFACAWLYQKHGGEAEEGEKANHVGDRGEDDAAGQRGVYSQAFEN